MADGGGGHAFLRGQSLSAASGAALLRGFRTGVPGAAEELWRVHAPHMLAVARGLLGAQRADMAADIVQRVLLDVLRLPVQRVEGVRDVGAFLAVATRNATYNAVRGENREVLRIREAARRAHLETRVDPVWETHAALARALAALSDEHRELLVLRHFVGLSFDQLAEMLDEKRSTLSSRYAHAKDALRERLEMTFDAESETNVDVKPQRKASERPESRLPPRGEADAPSEKAASAAEQRKIVGGNR